MISTIGSILFAADNPWPTPTLIMERDFTEDQKKMFYLMTGNTDEFNNPENVSDNNTNYPNAFFKSVKPGIVVSIIFL